jgi:hypothetical protein
MMITVYWVIFSLLIGLLGANKKMGFWGLFFCSLFLTPFIGIIILLTSARKQSHYHS